MKKLLLLGILLFVSLSYSKLTTAQGMSVSNPVVVNTFPTTITNVNTAAAASASGMTGSCFTLPCCSVLIYKVTLPADGSLRMEMTNFTPLAGSMIAYRPLVPNPTSFSDLEYVPMVANFCGFRDTMQLGWYYNWDSAPYGGVPNKRWSSGGLDDSVWDPNNPSNIAGFVPAGDYYVMVFNENQQAGLGIGNNTSLTFEFAEACAPLTAPSSIAFDTLEVSSSLDTTSFYLKNDRQKDVVIDTSNIAITGTNASDFSVLTYPDTNLAVGDSTLVELVFTASAGGQRTASIEFPFADTVCSTSSSISLTGTGAEPQVVLLGNNVSISNNDLTPSANNFTWMGAVVTHTGSLSQEFKITNTGSDTLELSGSPLVTLTGNAQFTVTHQPTSTILPGDTSSFIIEFTPVTDGSATTDVSIASNDLGQNPFTFRVEAEGAERNALHFDGSNDYVSINDVANQMTGISTWTMEAWIKADASQTANDHIFAVNTSGSGNPFLFRLDDGIFSAYDGSNSYLGGNQDLRDNTWHHVAVSYNSGDLKQYIDGFLVAQNTVGTISFSATDRWSLGQEYDGTTKSDYFKGAIDEVRIWNTVRSDNEIAGDRFCEIQSPASQPNLIMYFTMNQGVGSGNNSSIQSLTDFSGNSNSGLLYNFAKSGSTSNFIAADEVGINCSSFRQIVCGTYTSASGNIYDSTDVYIDTLAGQSSTGLDSFVIADLLVYDPVNITMTLDSNVSSSSSSDGGLSTTVNSGSAPFNFVWSNGASSTGDTLAFQSFEAHSNNNWNSVADPVTYATETDSVIAGSEDIWAVVREFTGDISAASQGVNFWGTQDLRNSNGGRSSFHFLTFDAIDISGQTGVKLSFDYYSDGFDASDDIEYQVIFDNDTTWNANGIALNKNTDAWTTVTINVPDSANFVRFRWQVYNDGSSDYSGLDNITLTSNKSSLTDLSAGTYTVTVTDANGCAAQASETLSAGIIATVLNTNISCNGLTDGQATASAAGGTAPYTYDWTNGATTAGINSLAAGTYTVTITENGGATATSQVTITEPTVLIAASVVDSNTTCNNFADGGASASATGGSTPYTYAWSNSATNASITGILAGTYSVTITDNNGCTSTSSATITQPAALTVNASVVSSVSTVGGSNGHVSSTAGGGTSPYNYIWSNGATTASIINISAGTYTVSVTDQNGCNNSSSTLLTEVTDNIAPVITVCASTPSNINASASCTGTAPNLTGSVTATDNITASPTITQSPASGATLGLGTTTITLTATDGVGNTATCTVNQTVIDATAPTITVCASTPSNISANSSCQGTAPNLVGSVTATDNCTASPTITQSPASGATLGLGTTTITLTATDGSGNTATCTVNQTVIDATAPTITVCASTPSNITASASCTGTAVDLTGSVTATDNCTATPTITQSPASGATLGLGTTTITLTATDGSGNTATCTVNQTVIDATAPTITVCASTPTDIIGNASNQGTTPNLVGGITATDNCTATPTITQSPAAGATLGLGTTTITLTATDGSGNTATCTVNQTVISPFSASISAQTNVTCNGLATGSATASTSGGTSPYTYLWSNGATTATASSLVAGTFTVTITENGGLTATASATITEPTTLVAVSVVDSNTRCNTFSNGGASASATGGTAPYAYAWNNAATTASITGIAAGSYTVTITDANGCTATSSSTVTEPAALVATTVVDNNISCNGLSDGGATASATGGTAPYVYAWNNAATTASITGVAAGTYTVTLTDANGCTSTSSATVTQPTALMVSAVVDSNVSCNGLVDGGATASATGGTAPYNYSWSNSATTASITGVAAGSYSVLITDANGCSAGTSTSITEPTALVAASVVDSNVTCNGFANGGASASATGGTAPYVYAWNNAATTASITGILAGTYTVTITDANGCTATSSSTITEPTALVAATVVDSNISCNGLSDGGATASVTGGTAPYVYAWNNAATTTSITGVMASTYTVTITDANGCTSTSSATITEPNTLVAAITLDSNESCMNTMDGGLTATETGGTSSYNYIWSTGATTATIDMLTAGTYTVTITDANGCTSSASETITHGLATSATQTYTVCDSVVSPSGMYTWITSGIYMDTLVNSIGCDSVITTNLTVNYSTSSTQVIASCDSYTSPSGFFVWTVSGIYTDLVSNAAGCDSTITIDLTITYSTDSTITVEACNEYNGVSGNQNWVTSGVYTDVIPNAAGCDSIVTVNLTINNSASITQNPEICNGDSIQVGSNWYTMAGTYVDTLTTMAGCDSIVTTMLDVEMVDVSVTDFNGTLRADNDFATSFQWINCDSNEIIAGATGQLFTPTITGNYAVVVNSINCVDTSDCYFVDLVGIDDLAQNIQIAVYPNPAGADQGTVLIEVANTPNYNIVIRDLTGKMVYNQNEVSVMQTEIDITEFAAGTFFIEIQTEQGSTFTKLVVM